MSFTMIDGKEKEEKCDVQQVYLKVSKKKVKGS